MKHVLEEATDRDIEEYVKATIKAYPSDKHISRLYKMYRDLKLEVKELRELVSALSNQMMGLVDEANNTWRKR